MEHCTRPGWHAIPRVVLGDFYKYDHTMNPQDFIPEVASKAATDALLGVPVPPSAFFGADFPTTNNGDPSTIRDKWLVWWLVWACLINDPEYDLHVATLVWPAAPYTSPYTLGLNICVALGWVKAGGSIGYAALTDNAPESLRLAYIQNSIGRL